MPAAIPIPPRCTRDWQERGAWHGAERRRHPHQIHAARNCRYLAYEDQRHAVPKACGQLHFPGVRGRTQHRSTCDTARNQRGDSDAAECFVGFTCITGLLFRCGSSVASGFSEDTGRSVQELRVDDKTHSATRQVRVGVRS
jgi:hypothetical protein